MLLIKWYFLLAVLYVIVSFYLIKDNEEFSLKQFFRSRWQFLVFNLYAAFVCVMYNTNHQLYCQPVLWAKIVLILFITGYLLYPFVRQTWLGIICLALAGLGFFIMPYLIFFGRTEYLIFLLLWVLFIGIPLGMLIRFYLRSVNVRLAKALCFVLYVPLFPIAVLFHLVKWIIIKRSTAAIIATIALPVMLLIASLFFTLKANSIIDTCEAHNAKEEKTVYLKSLTENPVDAFVCERLLGLHWKYHTEICLYDGWRPPFHDPFIPFSKWILFPYEYYPDYWSETKYEEVFPNKPRSFDCKCGRLEWY